MTTRAGQLARTIKTAARLDQEWQGKGGDGDRRYTNWMPFNADEFRWLLESAVAGYDPGDDENVRFLDVGCGPGSKMLIARNICGLEAHGFDRDAEYVAAARSLGFHADVCDAGQFTAYGRFQVIWFNRVARDAEIQKRIEAKVWHETSPGAVVICANLESPPPSGSWFPVLDDWEARRGIWMKAGRPGPGW